MTMHCSTCNSASDAPPRFPDHCTRHADVAEPGRCGECADARKARAAAPRPLTLVGQMRRCLVHAESYVDVCRGCRADDIAAEVGA